MKKMAIVLCLITTLLCLSSCGGDEESQIDLTDKTKITFYARHFEDWSDLYTKNIVDEFNKIEGNDVYVDLKIYETDAYNDALVVARENGQSPEIFLTSYSSLPQDAREETVAVLNDLFPEDAWNDLDSNILDFVTFKDNIYAFPWFSEPGSIFYYRKDILAKYGYNSAPKTFDELYEICEKIKGELRIGQYSLGLPATPSDLAWATWGLQQNLTGGLIVSDDWLNSRANEPGYKELAKFFYTCSVNKYANTGNITSDGYSNLAEALFDGNVMMCWGGSWQIALFYTLAEDSGDYSMIDKIGVAPIPTLTGDTNLTTATNGGWAYAVSSTAKGEKKAAAVKFIDWLFVKNPEILGDYFVRSKMSRTSASKKVQEYLKTVEVDVDSEWVEVVKNVSDKAIAEAYYPWDLSYQVSNMLQYFTQTTDKTYNIDSFNAKYATVVKKINYDIEQIMSRQSYTGNPWYEEE